MTIASRKDKTVTDISKAANKVGEPGMDDIKSDIEALRNDLRGLVSTVSQIASTKAETGVETGKEFATATGEKAQQLQGQFEDKVRANPLASIGIALGAGMLLATLRRS